MSLVKQLVNALNQLEKPWGLVVAYSGGMDSHVLLHCLDHALRSSSHRLRAVHVDHQLQASSAQWAKHCQTVCQQLAIELTTLCVNAQARNGESPEAKARQARYSALFNDLKPDEILVLAHHQQDQAETALLQLLRGTGVKGMAAMPQWADVSQNGMVHRIWRPFLDSPRQQLQDYAHAHRLSWIDDPSNESLRFDRNFLRHQVLPLIEQRWPAAVKTIARSSHWWAEADVVMERYGQALLLRINPNQQTWLDCGALTQLDEVDQKVAIRTWIANLHFATPRQVHLDQILHSVLPARWDATPLVQWADVQVRRFKNRLYIMSRQSDFDATQRHAWHAETAIDLPEINQQLQRVPVESQGILEHAFDQPLHVCFRRGGERYRDRSGHTKPLKQVFQQLEIPVWIRERVPLILGEDDFVIALGDLWVAPAYESRQNAGFRLQLKPLHNIEA